MSIDAKQVAELRKRTDCGMMECKKALQETNGDFEKAIDLLRTKGNAKAAKVSGRIAAEGIIVAKVSSDNHLARLIEINCETDFVGRDAAFKAFAELVANAALVNQANDVESLSKITIDGKTIEQIRQELVAKIGENISLRRVAGIAAAEKIGVYVHGGRIGVLVAVSGGDDELRKDLAMHIAASKPLVVSPEQVPAEVVAREKAIYVQQAQETGKPADLVEKMVAGRVRKFLNEVSLEGQMFVKQPDITVAQLLKNAQAKVISFVRFELGEGIEKTTKDFATEVAEQIKSL